MSAPRELESFRFIVAFSFAGPRRDKVRAIAEKVSNAIDPGIKDRSKGRVFFDEWFEHEILGSDMDVLLQDIYHKQSRMVVADLSEDYAGRKWPQAEARAIRALRMKLDTARDETARLRLLNLRLGEGDVPGVFNTEGYLDGIHKTAEECADVILKRHALLGQRLAAKAGLTEPAGTNPDSGTVCSLAGQEKKWVWRSTLASRAAGQVSILACMETLCAVALYWWIAIRYDTHWHLVSSVFIAPLLLLRSPESMDAGVRWFLKDWFEFKSYETWSKGKKAGWITTVLLVSAFPTYWFAELLSHRWLPGLEGWPLFGRATVIGMMSGAVAVVFAVSVSVAGSVAVAVTNAVVDRGMIAGAVMVAGPGAGAGSIAVMGAGVGAGAGAVAGTVAGLAAGFVAGVGAVLGTIAIAVAGAVAGAILGPSFGAGLTLRSFCFRMIATLRYLTAGIRRLPENWRENNFLTDSTLPAELLPGIRDSAALFSMDGLATDFVRERGRSKWLLYPLAGAYFFLPAFLYRLNIKATAWFWWPLAYLLKPAAVADVEGQQKQALCWPWTNPFQKLWIGASVLLALVSVTVHTIDPVSWATTKNVPALPLALRVSLAIDWAHIEPWHWAQWVIAGTGLGMLALAGNARSHDENGTWRDYRQRWPRNIRLMIGLQRVRKLATVALLLMALGALLLQDRTWQNHVPLPQSWITAMEQFYRL